MRKEETHILYVSYSNQKVLSSNAMVIAIPPVEGKTNIVRIYSKNTSLKLQVGLSGIIFIIIFFFSSASLFP